MSEFIVLPKIDIPYKPLVLPEAGGPYYVQGIVASSYEYNVAKALDFYGFLYDYQVDMLYGRRFIGGFILDFLVRTVPLPTPLFVNGDYWHKNEDRDRRQTSLLSSLGFLNKAIILWGKDTWTPDAAIWSIKEKFI